jgi:hypothetical protein
MEANELSEVAEKSKESNQKVVGVTMAAVAVLLAFSTMLGHRSHTEEILIETKANDQWAYYQAKNIRSHTYEANAELAALVNSGAKVADDFKSKAETQRKEAEEVQAKARDFETESASAGRRADRFDGSEIFLEVAIVLCSITLLTGKRTYWLVSFAASAIGAVLMAVALLTR